MKHLPQSMARTPTARFLRIFIGGKQWTVESAKSAKCLKADIRRRRVSRLSGRPGIKGYVLGSTVHLGAAIAWAWLHEDTVFRGRIEATPTGSRVRGRFTAGRVTQAFATFWFGSLFVFALLMLWSVVAPLACLALAWGGLSLLSMNTEEAEQNLLNYLGAVCGPLPEASEAERGGTTDVRY